MDIEAVNIREAQNGKVCIVIFPPTLGEKLYDSLPELIDKQIADNKKCFIFDFKFTHIIQSPAVACILECAEEISGAPDKSLVVCGLSEMNEKIFEMVGLFLYGNCCQNEDQAINHFSE